MSTPPTLAGVIQQSSGASYVMGLIAGWARRATLVDAAGHYMRKDIDVVREVVDGLGVDLGVLGQALDGGRRSSLVRRPMTRRPRPLTSTNPVRRQTRSAGPVQ